MEYFIFGLIVFLVVVLLAISVRIVPEYQRAVVFGWVAQLNEGSRFGLCYPFVDRAIFIDLRRIL